MIIVLLVVIAGACAWLAHGKGRNPALWFALGLLFSVVVLVIIACKAPMAPTVPAPKSCPDCGETVLGTARVCRFFRHEFAQTEPVLAPVAKPTLWQKLFWNPHVDR